ncbi:MAG: YidC/Oxa1 family insertase periplasmic-domain containing protein, partial [Bacteroidota bacterium]|nr:YidC/Oxa1 family insertase periplasmic-domain containing protein [Bacteroidota bacterium]
MEEKKFDKQSMIGFLLIGAILLFMLWQNQPSEEELAAQKAQEEQVEAQEAAAEKASQTDAVVESTTPQNDSLALERYKATLGSFAYSATLPSATDDVTELENDVLALKVSNKGGFITEARLKNFKSYDSVPVYLIKDGNSRFNLTFSTTDNRTLNSENLYFEPSLSKEGENQV